MVKCLFESQGFLSSFFSSLSLRSFFFFLLIRNLDLDRWFTVCEAALKKRRLLKLLYTKNVIELYPTSPYTQTNEHHVEWKAALRISSNTTAWMTELRLDRNLTKLLNVSVEIFSELFIIFMLNHEAHFFQTLISLKPPGHCKESVLMAIHYHYTPTGLELIVLQ